MKQKNMKIGIALLAAIITLALMGCPQPTDDAKNSAAELTSISVGGIAVDHVPTPISSAEWNAAEDDLAAYGESAYVGVATFIVQAEMQNAAVVVQASAGAKLEYGTAFSTMKPDEFVSAVPSGYSNNEYLYIKVTSEDGKNVQYYRVQIRLLSATATLSTVTVADVQAATLGNPGATWNAGDLTAGEAGISNAQKNNAKVVATPSNTNATVKYAKVTGGTAPGFDVIDIFTFADGDFLYIEVTAANGVNKQIYKLEVAIGRTATVSEIKVGSAEGVARAVTLGEPAATAAAATAGTVLLSEAQPVGGYSVFVTKSDAEAAVKYAKAAGTATPSFGTASTIHFNDGDFLYVEVTAANGTTKLYYKITVNLPQQGTIKYGHPQIKDSSEKYIDPLWNDVTLEQYRIEKIYPADSAGYPSPAATHGVAKAMWDEDGLYVYVEVTDPDVDPAMPTASDHQNDSLELFINEGGDTTSVDATGGYAGKGGQYRVGAHGEISGDATALTVGSAWTTATGYVIIMRGPWRYTTTYPLTNLKKIGFELQLNACTANGSRQAVIVWNNIAHTNYQNVTDYGEATLIGGDSILVHARQPQITAQPEGKAYNPGAGPATPLSVTANSADGGTLSYQWYSNTANSTTGGTPVGTNSNTYTPVITTPGTTYYYVVVTNDATAVSAVTGTKTATTTSGIATIRVRTADEAAKVEQIVAGGSSIPAYRFTPPAGSTWGDYTKMTFTVLVDQAALDANTGATDIRGHITGNYPASQFGANGTASITSGWGDHRLVAISAGGAPLASVLGEGYTAGTWKTLEYSIASDNPLKVGSYLASMYPAANATGPFYFGFGLTVNNNASGDRRLTYLVKDVALVKADGTKLPADDPDVYNNLKLIYSGVAGAVVDRTMETNPAP